MNIVNYQPTGVYKQFVKNPSLISSSFAAKGSVTPKQEDDKRDRRKKILMLAGAALALFTLFIGIRYYVKGLKILKTPDKDPLIKLSKNDYDALDKTLYKPDYLKKLEVERKIYEQCEQGIVGKIQNARNAVSDFFKNKFYNY